MGGERRSPAKEIRTWREHGAAVREGWRAYLDNASPTNAKMNALNPSMGHCQLCRNRRSAETAH